MDKRKRVLALVLKEFARKSFAKFYMSPIKEPINEDIKERLSFSYKIPSNVCRKLNKSNGGNVHQMSSAVILSLFDEISTYSIMMKDKTFRPGVSIHLSAEVMQGSFSDETVFISTRTDKIGKMIGFCSMEVHAGNKLVARGKHIKFLPMDLFFDVISNPYLQSFTLPMLEYLVYDAPKSALFNQLVNKKEIVNQKMNEEIAAGKKSVFSLLGLKEIANTDLFFTVKEANNINVDNVTCFEFKVKPYLCNYVRKMHGGAVALSIEEACNFLHKKILQKEILSSYVASLDVRYISAMTGDLILVVGEDNQSPLLPDQAVRSKNVGQIVRRKDGQLCAEFTVEWNAVV